jgi:hypothetical protein
MSAIRCCVVLLAVLATGGGSVGYSAEKSATDEIRLTEATIEITFTGDTAGLDRNEVREWIAASADAVQGYYGRFPVNRVRIRVDASEGHGARSGKTFAYNGALIRVGVGRESDRADLKRDWIMTHEMVHLAMPEFGERYAWLEEGLATYVEPVARVQAGQLTEEKIWRDMLQDMPKGLPASGDQGLDNTHTRAHGKPRGTSGCVARHRRRRRQCRSILGCPAHAGNGGQGHRHECSYRTL